MKIYHIERNTNKTLKEQKTDIMKRFENVTLIQSNGRTITVFADYKKEGNI